MDLSFFLAKIYGVVFTAVGLGMIINTKYYRKTIESVMKDRGIMYLGGVMALIAGFLIVSYHNIWVKDWYVLITIFGWLGLLKGVSLLVFPEKAAKMYSGITLKKNMMAWGIVALILGLIVGYFGFLV